MTKKTATLSRKVRPNATEKIAAPAQKVSACADPAAYQRSMGYLIGHLRRMGKLTQAEMADKVGLTRSSISNIESGIQTPQPITLSQMAEVLKIQEQEFFPKPGSKEEEYKAALEKLSPKDRGVVERFVAGK